MLKITKGQQQALWRKWRQSDQGRTYRQFRRSAEKMVAQDMSPYPDEWSSPDDIEMMLEIAEEMF
jgi:hypothetical protein